MGRPPASPHGDHRAIGRHGRKRRVDELKLESYYPFHATRANLLRKLGRRQEAAIAYERASELAPTEAERMFLRESASGEREQM